ncbi:MAG: DUF4911 domain-containing protein [Desulfobulbaceae bacterium]|jgi:hypothetical protein|nr:DUF4911 domain-containing protein [Desulfobulbaceae bacterium]
MTNAPPDHDRRCRVLYLRIAPARIGLLKFLLEGYDNLAVLSTDASGKGCVRLLVPRSRYEELMRFLTATAERLHL